jgi:uncharacterized membrane protein SpoIIM required for sporulation
MIHGVTELMAVTLACAGGFHIGWATAFPGVLSRLDAAAAAGRRAGVLLGGALVMLACAGLLEGIGRQLIENDWARYAIAAATAVAWPGYLYGVGRRAPTSAHPRESGGPGFFGLGQRIPVKNLGPRFRGEEREGGL